MKKQINVKSLSTIALVALTSSIIGVSTVSASSDETGNINQPALYTVQEGDNLYRISQRYNISIEELKQLNALGEAYMLHPGDQLKIKRNQSNSDKKVYEVKAGDSPYKIAQKFGVTVADIYQWNHIDAGTMLYPGNTVVVSGGTKQTTDTAEKGIDRIHEVTNNKYNSDSYEIRVERKQADHTVIYSLADKTPEKLTVFKWFKYDTATDRVFESTDAAPNSWARLHDGEPVASIEQTGQEKALSEEGIRKVHDLTDYAYNTENYFITSEVIDEHTVKFDVSDDSAEKITPIKAFKYDAKTGKVYVQEIEDRAADKWHLIN